MKTTKYTFRVTGMVETFADSADEAEDIANYIVRDLPLSGDVTVEFQDEEPNIPEPEDTER